MGGFQIQVVAADGDAGGGKTRQTHSSNFEPTASFKGKVLTLSDIRHSQQVNGRGNFADRYDLGDRLARGGFGTTYKAVEKYTGRLVVVKVPDDLSDTDDFLKLQEKSHPHIVRVFECFQDDTGCHIVMEYCSGGDLFHAFWELAKKEGGVSTNWCAHVFRDVVDGTTYLHETFQQAHNDIKPENILLERPAKDSQDPVRAMLADFGLVCAYAGSFEDPNQDGPSAGDPRYAAPELMNMARSCRPDPLSDTWSLGVTLYELAVGKLPWINVKNIRGWSHFAEFQDGKLLMKLFKKFDEMFSGKLKELSPKDTERIGDKYCRELLLGMLQVDETRRLNLRTVREHAFMKLADDLSGDLHGKVHLPYDVCRAHAARGVFKLREALLEIVESKLTGVPEYDEQLWMEADKDHNGVLSLEEFTTLWASVTYPPGEVKPAPLAVFEAVDVDSDGTICFDEFMTFEFDPRNLSPETREQVFRSAFMSIAGVGATTMTREHLRAVFTADDASCDVLFKELDRDEDGEITYCEFCDYLLNFGDESGSTSFTSVATTGAMAVAASEISNVGSLKSYAAFGAEASVS